MSRIPPLWLDYQRPAPGRHRLGQLLLIVGLALSVPLLGEYFSTSNELTEIDQRLATLRKNAERRQMFARVEQSAATDSTEKIVSPSADRWESLLASLEKAGDESVTLLSLTPGAKEVSIAGEASSFAASLDYVKRLQTAPVFTDAHLSAYEVVTGHPQHPVRFTLVALWREGLS